MNKSNSNPLADKPRSKARRKNAEQCQAIQCQNPIEVYCRLRPMQSDNDVSCVNIVSRNTLVISPPEPNPEIRKLIKKEIQSTFTAVFPESTKQREIFDEIVLPLVENLIRGKNSLLFAYGAAGSGKTFTMTGEPNNIGIIQRSLDVLFNSISEYQSKKFRFIPDKFNGFVVQSDADADAMQQKEIEALAARISRRTFKFPLLRRFNSDIEDIQIINREHDDSRIEHVDQDKSYAVFVKNYEMYNNHIYDLLAEAESKAIWKKAEIPIRKMQEDENKNMYVHAAVEVEVESAEEAVELFQRGQRKQHVARTDLNEESSRSHNIFTIRLVQVPSNSDEEQVNSEKSAVTVSQLSLVDLARTEGTYGSNRVGERLRDANDINNSLMALRYCMEGLRDNQTHGTDALVPYRSNNITYLFRNFFEGEGKLRMIICANPRVADCDETIQAMKFAEITQEIRITQKVITKKIAQLAPVKPDVTEVIIEAPSEVESEDTFDVSNETTNMHPIYNLGEPLPNLQVKNPRADLVITNITRALKERIEKRTNLIAVFTEQQHAFRKRMFALEQENMTLKIQNKQIHAEFSVQNKRVNILEKSIRKSNEEKDILFKTLIDAKNTIRELREELKQRESTFCTEMTKGNTTMLAELDRSND